MISAKFLKNVYRGQIERASFSQRANPLPFGVIHDNLVDLRNIITGLRDDLLVRH